MERKKLKYDINQDIESVYDEIQYAAAMAEGLEKFCCAHNGIVPMDLFVLINSVKRMTAQVNSEAERMWWKYCRLYGRD